MIAKFTKTECSNAHNYSNDKETIDTYNLVGYKKGQFAELVTVRLYMGRSAQASVVYCSLWVHGKNKKGDYISVSGKGSAGGYGYHKSSQALCEAITSAGIELYGSPYVQGKEKVHRNGGHAEKVDYKKKAYIGGCGESSMKDAIFAIGEALGYNRKQLHII